ncbi:hypothetical protein N3K66_000613 [Trichothecium roseum]|uniref:Uncharacterized protein n=1 Tax=Trichothecium roseum TaxID=47278 RepID=A0ACC0VCR3_9HYPO|nr:hypothetical protein N3K66_000613 [Trichothecium roseum]
MSEHQPSESQKGPWELSRNGCHVSLTYDDLNPLTQLSHVRSPAAGATVLFSGTTRDSFDGKPVSNLHYTAYPPLALRTMMEIAESIKEKHGLKGVSITHKLGDVPIGVESILIAVSSPHRQAAWRAGEEALEEIKEKVEVWKREEFFDGEGVWRANRDGHKGDRVS